MQYSRIRDKLKNSFSLLEIELKDIKFTKFVELILEYKNLDLVIKLCLSSEDNNNSNKVGQIAISYDQQINNLQEKQLDKMILKIITDNYLGLFQLCEELTLINKMFFSDDFSLVKDKLINLQKINQVKLKIEYDKFDYSQLNIIKDKILFVLSDVRNCSPFVHDPRHFYHNEFWHNICQKNKMIDLLIDRKIKIPEGKRIYYFDEIKDLSKYKKIIFFNITPESFKIINKFKIKNYYFIERTILADDKHNFENLHYGDKINIFTYYPDVNIDGNIVYSNRPLVAAQLDVDLYANSLLKFFKSKTKKCNPEIIIKNAVIHPVTLQYLFYNSPPIHYYDFCLLGNSNRDFKFIYEFVSKYPEYKIVIIYGNPSDEMYIEHKKYLELLNRFNNITILKSLDNEFSNKIMHCSKVVLLPFRKKSFSFSGVTCMNNPLNNNKLILASETSYTKYLEKLGLDMVLYNPESIEDFKTKADQALADFSKIQKNKEFAEKYSFNKYFLKVIKEINQI